MNRLCGLFLTLLTASGLVLPLSAQVVNDGETKRLNNVTTSAYPDFRLQSVNSLDGPGPFGSDNVVTSPTLLNGKFVHTNSVVPLRQFFRLTQ